MPTRKIVFLWENFGPMHIDRCNALAQALGGDSTVLGIQWTAKSSTYDWVAPTGEGFSLVTLFPDTAPTALSLPAKFWRTLRCCLTSDADAFFFSHYNDPAVFGAATVLTLLGKRVFAMFLSKFDDYDRNVFFELVKSFALLPYAGFLTNRGRSSDYLRFLRGKRTRMAFGHNTLSVREIEDLAAAPPAPAGKPHAERHFIAITRLVPKKNLGMLLEAYALYRDSVAMPKPLHICGSGELEGELKARIAALHLESLVLLRGFQQRPQIARELADSLALLLPSIEEQFGNVVIEAQALGVPAIISVNCGVRETLVRSGVNGFLIEPDNPAGLAFFMRQLHQDEALWRTLSQGCAQLLPRCDTPAFVEGVVELLGESATPMRKDRESPIGKVNG